MDALSQDNRTIAIDKRYMPITRSRNTSTPNVGRTVTIFGLSGKGQPVGGPSSCRLCWLAAVLRSSPRQSAKRIARVLARHWIRSAVWNPASTWLEALRHQLML